MNLKYKLNPPTSSHNSSHCQLELESTPQRVPGAFDEGVQTVDAPFLQEQLHSTKSQPPSNLSQNFTMSHLGHSKMPAALQVRSLLDSLAVQTSQPVVASTRKLLDAMWDGSWRSIPDTLTRLQALGPGSILRAQRGLHIWLTTPTPSNGPGLGLKPGPAESLARGRDYAVYFLSRSQPGPGPVLRNKVRSSVAF